MHIQFCAVDCIFDGILRYAATQHRSILSKWVFRQVDSPAVQEQLYSRDKNIDDYSGRKPEKLGTEGYYVFFHIEK